jgi:hypothetical protein
MNNVPNELSKRVFKKICCIVSFLSQKQHVVCPFQFLFTTSFVKITLRCRNHRKTFIFSDTFIFQIYFLRYLVLSFRRSRYMDLTVKPPKALNPHTNTSRSLLSWTCINFSTSCSHSFHLVHERVRRKAIFSREWLKTSSRNLFSLDYANTRKDTAEQWRSVNKSKEGAKFNSWLQILLISSYL